MNLLLATKAIITVRLVDFHTKNPLTDSRYPLVHIQKYGFSNNIQILASAGINWFEIDPVNMPGIYDLHITEMDTNTLGTLIVSVIDPTLSLGDSGIGSDTFTDTHNIVPSTINTIGYDTNLIRQMNTNKYVIDPNTFTYNVYDDAGVNIIKSFLMLDQNAQPNVTAPFSRIPK